MRPRHEAQNVGKAEVARHERAPRRLRLLEDDRVGLTTQPDFTNIFGVESCGAQPPRERPWKIFVDEEARAPYLTDRTRSSPIVRAA